jgi:enterochelin esterase-like enzyme
MSDLDARRNAYATIDAMRLPYLIHRPGGSHSVISFLLFFALSSAASDDLVTVTFRVETLSMPDTNAVVVVGSCAMLGAWDHAGALVLEVGPEGFWEGSIALPTDSLIAFRVTRGAWSREALTAAGVIPPDSWLRVAGDSILTLQVPKWRDEIPIVAGGVAGTVIRHEGFPSEIMGVRRDLWILLPRSYCEQPSRRYPVLYVQDGRNVFDPTLSYAGVDWQLDEAVDTLSTLGRIPEIIVVAIESSPRRMFEYADTTLGELYGRFMIEELKPYIDNEYRTRASREHTAVMGSAMGGLMSFLLAWWYPDTFGQAACLSPVFLWGDGKTLDRVEKSTSPQRRPRLFLAVGTKGLEAELAPGMHRMRALLQEHGWRVGDDLVCQVVDGAGHHEQDWAARMYEALPFLFSMKED